MFESVQPTGATARTRLRLRILATTDLHLQLCAYDYFTGARRPNTGLAAAAALAQRLRREAPNTLFFDCGDFLQGTPMADFLAHWGGWQSGAHPMIAAMNAARYDAATLGNHDFDYGLGFLLRATRAARHPMVLANVATRLGPRPECDETLFPPYVLLRRDVTDDAGRHHELCVGVIGFAPPQLAAWNRRRLGGRLHTRDIVEAARAWVPRMREAGAELVVALSHSGIGESAHVCGMENAAVPLAAVEGVDVVVAGHQHDLFPRSPTEGTPAVDGEAGTLHGKPAVMAGAQGTHLGLIDLIMERHGRAWRIAGHQSRALPVAPLAAGAAASEVIAATEAAHRATLAHIHRPAGRSAAALTTHFALLGHAPTVRLLNAAQRWHMRPRLAAAGLDGLPLLSAAASARAGGRAGPQHYTNIPPGEISLRHLAEICPFPNTLAVLRITGADLRGWLERAASLFCQVTPGQTGQALVKDGAPPYDFDIIDGISYEIDLSRPESEGRVVNLRRHGQPVRDDAAFLMVTNSYRAAGGGRFPGTGGEAILESEDTSLEILTRFVEAHGTIVPASFPVWRFRPLGGAEVFFDTAPGAADHLEALEGFDITPEGPAPGGFMRFRLRL
ncbi:2',3'-cyclic-nucleotide 2'-phosphodiesterase / 3'-nucleotidase [Meinhardsimonia xiamenensis]|jgi:2',3'-cyclic-nucleotide 2'-phosphodiesterase/3'-nucleotidase|uniref:2',3'-cyclic-nucleotide 2'-phosphodiesterase / 3'-nucleotidase n=1 Tax=Meinhardsimonia xiamenensis TaxID=990712 RepID=A0A1G9CFB8_9RHOB|nr:bifunctional 2',3'-cyclic-nucleotide 2'-phosphodiesterase/3'-nucleotidase [Meinhardsimonia xiamenensis]PRX38383.1 2',3'-cyclic-nucleotide 2'-phosphodiesterase/3'-nucleotidase [Meinhardsimonia xiamenensis]SDK50276.1 2',3'-cyclic-nucleotide 2'-phosphodiesterase / 3'-nucleotidase [Meinhardsimonia xiamenensis]